jgi:hypothetical protein
VKAVKAVKVMKVMKVMKIVKIMEVLKQAHIELIHSNRLKWSSTIHSEYDWKGCRRCYVCYVCYVCMDVMDVVLRFRSPLLRHSC